MRLVSLSIKGYRQFLERTELQIPIGLTGICGPNGVGKSKLIEAIGYALFGVSRMLPSSDKQSDLASVGGGGRIDTEVCLVLEVRGQFYRIRRTSKARECCIELLSRQGADAAGAVPLATSPSEVTKKVIEIFGITPEAFLRTFVARQKEIAGIQAIKTPSERQKLINRLIGIAQIEKALSLAEGERKQRTSTLDTKIADEADLANVDLAKTNLMDCQGALVAAAEKEEECLAGLHNTRRMTLDGRRNKEAWHGKFTEMEAKRAELGSLETDESDLKQGIEDAVARNEECLLAHAAVETADKVLEETRETAGELARYANLQELAVARKQLEGAAEYLKTAQANLEAHRACEEQLTQAVLQVEILRAESVQKAEALKTARSSKSEAERQTEVIRERLHTVRSMGAQGKCEKCGQQLGENLHVALSGLAEELKIAEALSGALFTQEQSATVTAQAAEKAAEDAEQKRDGLRDQFVSGESAPGQFGEAQKHHQAFQAEIANYPAELALLPYDAVGHREAEEKMQARTAAEATRVASLQTAEQRPASGAALSRATRLLAQNTDRRKVLEAELAALTDVEAFVRAAGERLAVLEESEVTATALWEEARSARSRAEAALEPAQEKLRQAERRAGRIAVLRHDLEIAERTEGLLRATRDEITAELCPRLAEMMDNWARSLMGSHFRCVQLTADYRIEADNGSGMHTIEHFSGGEQTLLAVMLRVAISLYCQERSGMGAGFLVLDEVFGDQDELHRAQLIQFLNEIKPHYHQILIVNHVPDVTDMLGSIIEVSATGEKTSKAVLRL